MNSLRQQALDFFTKVHEGQFRRDGITPYITHPIAVAGIAIKLAKEASGGFLDEETEDLIYIVSLGHDSVEDHPDKVNLEDITKLFGARVSAAIDNLTKRAGETYLEAILRAKKNFLSRIPKIADNTHNLSTLDEKKDKTRVDKYLLSKYILEN